MLHVFHTYVQVLFYLDVAKVDLDVAHVAMAIHACVDSSVLFVFSHTLQAF
jgi:hypothetical protein